jgi:hypothetical protein
MANYLIKHTDPANGSFLVQDDQIDGTNMPWDAALYVNPVSSLTALTSNSSLVIPGRGITDYGELIANDLIHAMEHFAYRSRPLTPAQGQIWYKNVNYTDPNFPTDPILAGLFVWNGIAWDPLLSAVGGVVNLAGARIANLGNAIAATDALNRQTGDGRYVMKIGDTMTGLLILSGDPVAALGAATKQYVDTTTVSITGDTMTGLLILSGDPVAALGAATKQYVDTTTVSITGDTMTGLLVLSADPVAALGAATKQYVDTTTVSITGDTMTGDLIIDTNASLLFAGGGTGIINGGTRRIQNISDPTANQDAATKFYVDQAVTGVIIPPGVDTYVTSISFDGNTGELTLTRNDAVVISSGLGQIAGFNHTHTTSAITYDLSAPYSQSILRSRQQNVVGYPTIPVYNAISNLDQTVAGLIRPISRQLFTGTGVLTSFDCGPYMTFSANENRAQVFIDGVKQYVNQRGRGRVVFQGTAINLDTLIGITGPYLFNITVDGVLFAGLTLTATTTAIKTLFNLVGGTLYTNGTYLNVPLTGGSGAGATANITVAGGTVVSVELVLRGTGYTVGNTLSALAANIGGTGSGFTIQVQTLSGPYSFFDMLIDLQAIFTNASIPVSVGFEQYFNRLIFNFDSDTTGAGSSIVVSSAASQLFTFPSPPITFQVAAPINTSVTQNLSYIESFTGGNVPAGTQVSEITFTTPPPLGSIIEVLVLPS